MSISLNCIHMYPLVYSSGDHVFHMRDRQCSLRGHECAAAGDVAPMDRRVEGEVFALGAANVALSRGGADLAFDTDDENIIRRAGSARVMCQLRRRGDNVPPNLTWVA